MQVLPLDYDPDIIADYWGRRPIAVTTRIFQLLGAPCSLPPSAAEANACIGAL